MIRPRVTYANVVSSLALFVAFGGTSYAVAKLPRNSVGTEQVRDRTLRAADLAPGTLPIGLRGPRGAEGAPGPVGPRGEAGPKGDRGPSDVVSVLRTDAVTLPLTPGISTLVVRLKDLPAGNWTILGSTTIAHFPGSPAQSEHACQLVDSKGGVLGGRSVNIGNTAGSVTVAALTVPGVASFSAPTDVRMVCGHFGGAVPAPSPYTLGADLRAVRTDGLQHKAVHGSAD